MITTLAVDLWCNHSQYAVGAASAATTIALAHQNVAPKALHLSVSVQCTARAIAVWVPADLPMVATSGSPPRDASPLMKNTRCLMKVASGGTAWIGG
eukprot:14909650-Heterocapsa_arctica.AAC.1